MSFVVTVTYTLRPDPMEGGSQFKILVSTSASIVPRAGDTVAIIGTEGEGNLYRVHEVSWTIYEGELAGVDVYVDFEGEI